MLTNKHLLGLKDTPPEDIAQILQAAAEMKSMLEQNITRAPHLQGKNVCILFYENSTRTKTSFENAAKFLSANVSSISVASSSVAKGETLIDTGKTLDALLYDVMIMRHSMAGAPHLLAKNVQAAVINAGDGINEHPTQALLDMLTLQERFGRLQGLKVLIVGDIKHSRVAKSNIYGLQKMGAEVAVCAPKTLLPMGIEAMGARVFDNLQKGIAWADAVMGLRVQLERQQAGLFSTKNELSAFYCLTNERMLAAKEPYLLHPGPINRGLEVSSSAADADYSAIERQVTNGLAVRMALLFLLTRKA